MPETEHLDVLLVDDEDYYATIFSGWASIPLINTAFLWMIGLARILAHEPPRLAVAMLSAYAKQAGLATESIYNLSRGFWKRRRLAKLLRRQPLVVGISTTAIQETRTLERIVAKIRRESPRSVIVLGGYGAQFCSAMRRLGDVTVTDCGEIALPQLACALKSNAGLDSIAGILRGPDGARTLSGRLGYDEEEVMLPPDWSVLNDYYTCYPIEASRGCRYNCSYCTVPGKKRQTYRKPGDVVAEMTHIVRDLGKKYIYFVDSNLTSGSEFMAEFLALLKSRKLGAKWHCLGRIDDFARRPSLAKDMAETGCYNVYLGIESIHDHILAKMRKGYTRDVIDRGVESIAAARLPAHANFIIGFPGETPRTAQETYDFIIRSGFKTVGLAPLMVPKELFDEARADPDFYCHLSGETPTRWSHDTMDYGRALRLVKELVSRVNRYYLYPVANAPPFWRKNREQDVLVAQPGEF